MVILNIIIDTVHSVINFLSPVLAILFGYLWYRGESKRNEYNFIESQLNNILRLQIEHPEFLVIDISALDRKSIEYLRYDAYCKIILNTMSTITEKYGRKRFKKSSFFNPFKMLVIKNKDWFESGQASRLPNVYRQDFYI